MPTPPRPKKRAPRAAPRRSAPRRPKSRRHPTRPAGSPTAQEVCLLIAKDGSIVWSDASQSALALPDSRARWEAIWENRERLALIVHSHPLGPRDFSHEDDTTMVALDAALGRSLQFAVLAPAGLVFREGARKWQSSERPWWLPLLALASGMNVG